jgi:hypothetical protein
MIAYVTRDYNVVYLPNEEPIDEYVLSQDVSKELANMS